MRAVLAAAAAAIVLMMPAAAPAPAVAQAQRDWTKVVVATPEGGFRMGNPDARIKVVEYGSLTCPHCARFATQGVPKLVQNYVKSGRVSFELRNFVRNPHDMAGALLSGCAGAAGFFPMVERIFATQDQWVAKFGRLSASEYDALEALPQTQKLTRIAAIAGFDALAARHGVPAAKARACLADEKAIERLVQMRQVAVTRFGLEGTPTFVIDGRTAKGVSDWGALEPLLRGSGG